MNITKSDYCAIIAKVESLEPIAKADNIQVAYVIGEPVIVSIDIEVGYVGVFFPPDTQLSPWYLSNNNLYRESEKNLNKDKKGFFEANGKVRAQPFLGVKSCGYFADIGSLDFTGQDTSTLVAGDRFEELNTVHIANKWVNPNIKSQGQGKQARKKIETPLFKEHVSTDQFKYHVGSIKSGDIVSIQAKGHGTSARYSNTLVVKELPRWKQLINNIVPIFPTQEWEYVAGTRRVVLKTIDKDKDGFHGSEAFRFEILEQLKPHLSKGVTVYGEIVGFANGKPIMGTHEVSLLKDKKYTKKYGKSITYKYGCMQESYKFYAYRVTITSMEGEEIDLTEPQLQKWCKDRGIEASLNIVDPFIYYGNEEALKDLVDKLTEREDLLTEDYRDASHVSEGVVVRVDSTGLIPKFYKNKSKAFRILEGIYNENNVNIEDAS